MITAAWYDEQHRKIGRTIRKHCENHNVTLEDLGRSSGLGLHYVIAALKKDQYHNIVRRTQHIVTYSPEILEWAHKRSDRALKGQAKPKRRPRELTEPVIYDLNKLMRKKPCR